MNKKKISELSFRGKRKIQQRDTAGNLITKEVPYEGKHKLHVVHGGKRFAHFFVDLVVFQVLIAFIDWIDIFFRTSSEVYYYNSFTDGLLGWLMFPFYYVVFEHIWQKTPGKFLTRCRVVNEYGERPDLQTNILRNIIRLVPFEPFSCLEERGWHDRWSDTFVISDDEFETISKLLDEQEAKE